MNISLLNKLVNIISLKCIYILIKNILHFRAAMANAIIHSRPPSYRSHNSDHEVVTPQLDGNNVPERDQQTLENQVLSTTAEINATDNSEPNYISTSTHSMPNQSAPEAAQKAIEYVSNASLDDTRAVAATSNFGTDIDHANENNISPEAQESKTSGTCDTLAETNQDFSQNRASHFQSSVHLNNISSLNCNTGTINSQQQEHGGKYRRQNLPSLPQNEIKSLDRVESAALSNEPNRIPLYADNAFEVTNSAAEMMKTYTSPTSSSDVWQLRPTSSNLVVDQSQSKSLPPSQVTHLSPSHLQQYLNNPTFNSGLTGTTEMKNIFDVAPRVRINDKAANISMDTNSVLSHTSTSTSSSASTIMSTNQVNVKKDNDNLQNNHSSLVTIIHHQKSSSDYEESDSEQSSFGYSRLGSERYLL